MYNSRLRVGVSVVSFEFMHKFTGAFVVVDRLWRNVQLAFWHIGGSLISRLKESQFDLPVRVWFKKFLDDLYWGGRIVRYRLSIHVDYHSRVVYWATNVARSCMGEGKAGVASTLSCLLYHLYMKYRHFPISLCIRLLAVHVVHNQCTSPQAPPLL